MSVECAVGGHWERLVHAVDDNVSAGGYTQEFTIDGSQFKMARFDLAFAGQSINLNINGNARCWGGINFQKHDGSGRYLHPNPINNSRYALFSRGTGNLRGFLIPRRITEAGWLMVFHGYSAYDGAGGWTAAGNDYWRTDGRVFIGNSTAAMTWGMRFGFSTNEAGAINLTVEGLRG